MFGRVGGTCCRLTVLRTLFQVVHLIRHGQGEHNIAVQNAGGDKSLYKSYEYFDARLTAFGWEQVLFNVISSYYLSTVETKVTLQCCATV